MINDDARDGILINLNLKNYPQTYLSKVFYFPPSGSSYSRSSTEAEKRPCSPSVGGYSRSVPVARADGSDYLASCAYQGPSSTSSSSTTNNSYQSGDSVVPNKPFENKPFENKPFDTPNSHSGK